MIPTRLGQITQGGIFVGFLIIKSKVYGIVVSPKTQHQYLANGLRFPAITETTDHDGSINTTELVRMQSPAAMYCTAYSYAGYTDWYLPSLFEISLAITIAGGNTTCDHFDRFLRGSSRFIPLSRAHTSSIILTELFAGKKSILPIPYWTSTVTNSRTAICVFYPRNKSYPFDQQSFNYVLPFRRFAV